PSPPRRSPELPLVGMYPQSGRLVCKGLNVPQSIDPIDYKSSFRLAADQIRRAIDLGTYLPGERLPPSRELAFQLGISVATLREAVRGLIDEGLVELRRGDRKSRV